MKSRYSHVLMLFGALLAFLPIIAVDHLLDAYVRVRETAVAQQAVSAVTAQIETGAAAALDSLRAVISESPSFCTPTFVSNAQRKIEGSLSLKQILVENSDGVQYCDAIGRPVTYSPISDRLPLPGQPETITVVKYGTLDMPALKITQSYGDTREVSAFVPLLPQGQDALQRGLQATSMMRVVLTNGTAILTIGDAVPFERRTYSGQYVFAQGFAGELPLKVEYAVPFAMARTGYADLDIGMTTVACLFSAVFLLISLYLVRRTRVPAFDLERAIGRGEIKPYYQPVINLRTGELMGCEVLCRWEKRNGQIVSPGAFIDYAETTGLAIPMTLSLMQQVKFDLSELSKDRPDLKISINLFEGHFRDGSIVEDVQAIFSNSAIDFRQLVFEITERHPLANSAIANSVIGGLHALGCRLALDDAGTGHSNLAYLGTLGVDIIKIDRVFVDMVKPGTTQVPVLDGLITMAQDLNCEIVAEGVETEEQALYLRSHGVVQAQGFIFAPALRVDAFKELVYALHAPKNPASAEADVTATAA